MGDPVKKEFVPDVSVLKRPYKIEKQKGAWKFEPKSHNIFLIGPRGSGKTTLGKVVAKELKMKFIDTDEEIVKYSGVDIENYVKRHGWEKFRDLESEVLKQVCTHNSFVCATGGGIVLKEENRSLIRKKGVVFYLKGDVLTLEKRIMADEKNKNRPPLTDLSLRDELEVTLRERDPLYMSTAHFILRADKELGELKIDLFKFLGWEG